MRLASLSAALLAALIVLAGCGGKSTPASTSATAGTHPDAPPPAHASSNPRDALIRITDLSSSWTAGKPMGSALGCEGWDPLRGAARVLESQSFTRTPVDVQQTLGLFADDAAATRAYRRLVGSATARCVSRAVRRLMRYRAGAGTAFTAPVKLARSDDVGEHSHEVRLTTDVNGELGRGTATIVVIDSHVGRAAASLAVYAGLAQLAEAAYDELVAAQERRLGAVYG
jgi:hypothetical protein